MKSLLIREPKLEDEKCFLEMTQCSEFLHSPWVSPPLTSSEFAAYFQRTQQSNQKTFLLCTQANEIVGVFNLSEIIRGFFQNAFLGFYVNIKYAGQGHMLVGLQKVIHESFTHLGLHRLEANIQPENTRSINLVKKAGFRKEGISLRYLNINGNWCDHERWAITHEDWIDISL